jgi:hypothetical protein
VKNFVVSTLLLIFFSPLEAIPAVAQIPVNEDGSTSVETSAPTENTYGRIASDILDLRDKRKMAIGFSALGPTGYGGFLAEINFLPSTSLVGGYGFGSNFQAFHFGARHIFGGTWFAPYMGAGFAHWSTSSSNGPLTETQPGYLGSKLLSGDQVQRGSFQLNLLYPTAGLQYTQLSGEFAGLGVYVEVDGLLSLSTFAFVPTGSTGLLYYF